MLAVVVGVAVGVVVGVVVGVGVAVGVGVVVGVVVGVGMTTKKPPAVARVQPVTVNPAARTLKLQLWITPTEKADYEARSAAMGLSVSAWVRLTLREVPR